MPRTEMRDVSTPHQERYQTDDGNVTVTKFKERSWQVMPRGKEPFLVGSKREAFKQARGIAGRHWGMPRREAFPQRSRAHAATKKAAGLSAEQRAEIDAALSAYGARLTEDDRIAKGDKVMSVHLEAKGGRLKMIGGGNQLASYPASRAGQGVSDFVEKFWYWTKAGPARSHATKKSPAQLDREIAEALSRAPRRGGAPRHGGWQTYDDLPSELSMDRPRPRGPRGGRQHARKAGNLISSDRRKIRYVSLAWSDPSADPSRRHVEGSFPQTNVDEILEGLFRRGVPEVTVEDREFALTSLDAVHDAAKHAHDSVARRGRRGHATMSVDLDEANLQIAPTLGKTPAQIVRAINAIVREAKGRNVYLVSTRLGTQSVRRVVGARAMPGTKGRGLDVRLLDTGVWQGVMPEMGDRIEVR